MTLLDIILIVVLALFFLNGWRTGLINMIGSILGLVVGVVLAGRWYVGFSGWLAPVLHLNPLIANVVAFGILLAIIERLVGVAFSLVNRVFKLISIVPGVGLVNRLAGAGLGLLEGVLLLGVILVVATKFDVGPNWRYTLENSTLIPFLTGVSQIIVPLLPKALKSLQSVISQNI